MGTVNFSVPDAVKRAFERTFAGQNKSGVLTGTLGNVVSLQDWVLPPQAPQG